MRRRDEDLLKRHRDDLCFFLIPIKKSEGERNATVSVENDIEILKNTHSYIFCCRLPDEGLENPFTNVAL